MCDGLVGLRAVQLENAFPEAATPDQCFAAFESGKVQNRQAVQNARRSSAGQNWLGTAIGLGIGSGVNESVNNNRYALCLQRVGATDADLRKIEARAGKPSSGFGGSRVAAPSIEGARCPGGVSGMYGGNGYCFQ